MDVFESDKNVYIVTDLCEGKDLFQLYCERNETMREQDAAVLMKTVLKALIHCHSNNIVHRDIKLENIMFNSDDITDFSDIKIIDFGLSKVNNNGFGLLNTVVGKFKNLRIKVNFCNFLNITKELFSYRFTVFYCS